jgi:hypothetical protein
MKLKKAVMAQEGAVDPINFKITRAGQSLMYLGHDITRTVPQD